MKYSNTAITQLTRWYKQVLIKCAIFNAALFIGGAMITAPANAYTPVDSRTVVAADETRTFDNNSFIDLHHDSQGGAIENNGTLSVSNSLFENDYVYRDTSTVLGGAIYATSSATTNIENTIFSGNKANNPAKPRGGAIHNSGDMNITGSTFVKNESINTGANVLDMMASAIYNSSKTLTLTDNTFGGDTVADANKGNSVLVNNGGTVYLSGNTFKNNSIDKEGAIQLQGATAKGYFNGTNTIANNSSSALFNWIGADTTFNAGSVTNIDSNNATQSADANSNLGGGIHNESTVTFEEGSTVNFTNNTAKNGGAVYNSGTVNFNGDATFSDNTDENGANDIYNAGTINFGNANEIALTGGIDGSAGTVNVNGVGGVSVAKALKNQTVNVASELHLDAANVTGSTINLGSDGVLNTINNAIEDYSAIELADGSNIKVDANLDLQQMDKFSAGYGKTSINLNIVEANMMGTATSANGVQLVNNGVKVNTSSAIYEWDDVNKKHLKTGIEGSGNADGKVNISNGESFSDLEMVADGTQSGVKESVVYEMGENEDFDTATIEDANFIVEGNNQSVNVSGTFGIDNKSVVTMNNVVFDGDGKITTYGKLKINDSEVNVDLNVLGGAQLESDPTSFSGVVTIDSLSTGSFDNDTFESTAVLKNSGTVDFKDMTFESGSRIEKDTTAGTLNFNGGDYDLVVTGNNINLKNGADIALIEGSDIDGLALTNDANNGTIDLRNKRIDTLGSTVLGSDLNVLMDVNLNTAVADSLGTITTGGYGLNLNALELLALGGDTENIQIATAGTDVALSSSVMDTLHTYYKNVNYDSLTGILTLDTKASPVTDLIGSWGTGNYIKAYDASDSANTSVGANLTILDDQVKTNADDIAAAQTAIGGINDDITVAAGTYNYIAAGTEVANNLVALDTAVATKQDALTAGSGIDITSNVISVKDATLANFDAATVTDSTEVAALLADPTTASDSNVLTEKAVVTGIGALFNEKQTWVDNTLGIVSAHADAVKEQYASTNYLTTAETLTGADKLLDTQIKANADAIATKLTGAEAADYAISGKRGAELAANIATYVSANGDKFADVQNTANIITDLFNDKALYIEETTGMDQDHSVAYNYNQSSQALLHGATSMLNADEILAAEVGKKQDKLVIAADSGLKWNDANQTQLAVKVNEDKGLKVTSNGIEINAGDTMQFSTSGKLDVKYDTNTFTATTTDGLKIASKGIKAGMIDDGAVGFANLATDAVATSITGATNKVATDAAVKAYAEKVVSDAITFNTDNTVTLTVGSNSANVYDTTGTANYVKANAQSADYTALTSGAVDLTTNTSIAGALQTLDAAKASLAKDNTFTGANTFKSDSGIVLQNATTPSVSSNLVATQLTIGTDTHDVLQVTVSDTSGDGSALYVKDADIATNGGFIALDSTGMDRFTADEDGIELKNASGDTTFFADTATGNLQTAGTLSVAGGNFTVDGNGAVAAAGGRFTIDKDGKTIVGNDFAVTDKFTVSGATGNTQIGGDLGVTNKFKVEGATGNTYVVGTFSAADGNFTVDASGNTAVAGTMDIEGDTTIGDKFSVTAADGSFSAAGGKFAVNENGSIAAADNKFVVNKDGNITKAGTISAADGTFLVKEGGEVSAAAGTFLVKEGGIVTAAAGKFQIKEGGLVSAASGNFLIKEDGAFSASNGNFTVDKDGNVTAQGDLGVQGTSWLKNTNVDGALAVTGTSWLKNTNVDGALAVSGDSTVGQNFAVAGTSYLHDTSVTGDMAVSGTTRTGALTFDGASYVAAMDQGAAAITGGVVDDQAKRTMATNATVAKTVGNLASLATAANGVTSANDVADAINSLGLNVETATGGTFAADGVWTGTVTGTKAVDYAQNVAYNDLVSAVDQVSSNIGAETTATYGNITSANTVNANLDQLDASIGDRSFNDTHYVAPNSDLASATRVLDSNLYRIDNEVKDLRKDVNRGFASMAALSALVPNARANGNTQVSVGTGMYSGHTGFALGGFHWFNDNLLMNVGVAYGDGDKSDVIYRAGVTYSW